MFTLCATTTFLGKNHKIGHFTKNDINLKMIWNSVMELTLDLIDALVEFEGRKIHQIHFNVDYLPVANVESNESNQDQPNQQQPNQHLQHPNPHPQQQATQHSEYDDNLNELVESEQDGDDSVGDETYNEIDGYHGEDKVENLGVEMGVHENSDDSEFDGSSDVNGDDISEEVVREEGIENGVKQLYMGRAFRLSDDGRIRLEVGQLFRNLKHFRDVILDYSIQEGFKLNKIKNERNRIISSCDTKGCQWRVHGSPTYDRTTYMLKTLINEHNCLAVSKNKDVTSAWIGKKFETLIKENPQMNIEVLSSIVLRSCGVNVPKYTLYRAKRYALDIGFEDHKQSYNKLNRYGYCLREINLGSFVYLSTIRYNPDPNVLAHFNRFFLSFHAQKIGYLEGCRPFIGLDGCNLKSPHEGILFCTIALDANCGVYPLALGVCEIECFEIWKWFVMLLHEHVGMHERRTMCFMTDRQKGIPGALSECWPNNISRFCGRHILQNMMSKFKIDYLKELFWHAARSSNRAEFLEKMRK
ncbi:hypothetical protein Ddye_000824 [Dipteronia dyeriana]|uniref:Transposase n=1 Tax=Dipteronia dyeriana TaxID=168575 RepID=A0AAD9XMN8_9ROSI|nr:hypothetical protein Ddye_000824 [Dipteronia dyeriana]